MKNQDPTPPSPEQKMREAMTVAAKTALMQVIPSFPSMSQRAGTAGEALHSRATILANHFLSALQSSGCLKVEGAVEESLKLYVAYDCSRALLAKCFDHLGGEIRRMSLNESAANGTQALHKEIAEFLDDERAKVPPTSHQPAPSDELADVAGTAEERANREANECARAIVTLVEDRLCVLLKMEDCAKIVQCVGEAIRFCSQPPPPAPISSAPDGAGTTPETDAAILQVPDMPGYQMDLRPYGHVVKADFARKLEQQRDALKRENDRLRKAVEAEQLANQQIMQAMAKYQNALFECGPTVVADLRASLAQAQRDLATVQNAKIEACIAWTEANDKLTAASQEVEGLRKTLGGVCELALCESESLVLKPNQLYRFSVYADCKRCAEIAARSATPEERTK